MILDKHITEQHLRKLILQFKRSQTWFAGAAPDWWISSAFRRLWFSALSIKPNLLPCPGLFPMATDDASPLNSSLLVCLHGSAGWSDDKRACWWDVHHLSW